MKNTRIHTHKYNKQYIIMINKVKIDQMYETNNDNDNDDDDHHDDDDDDDDDDDGKVYLTQPMDLICIELGISFDNLFLYVRTN